MRQNPGSRQTRVSIGRRHWACLHAHGWTTQIPQVFDVAVLASRSLRQFERVHLVPRPKRWFAALLESGQLLRAGESPFSIESVTPEFALEDAREFQDVWVPDPDDLDIPVGENQLPYRPGVVTSL
jgi:hypothetical protein